MKIAAMSDLHIEFEPYRPDLPSDIDVVILAGDIALGTDGMAWAKENLTNHQVIYVAGNHEFYRNDLHPTLEALKAASNDHVHFLENAQIEIDGVRFLGCTYWTDCASNGTPEISARNVAGALNDFHGAIMNGERKFTIDDAIELHQQSRAWLEAELAIDHPGKTVVVTHHAPVIHAGAPMFHGGPISPGFENAHEDLVAKSGARLWCFGHTHYDYDRIVGNDCRVVSSQRCYPKERTRMGLPAFEPKIVEV